MKVLNTHQTVSVPEGIEMSVKSRVVTVKGSRGTLSKSFKHLAVDIFMPTKDTVRVEKWFGKKKELAAVRTVCSHITNLINGVTSVRGWQDLCWSFSLVSANLVPSEALGAPPCDSSQGAAESSHREQGPISVTTVQLHSWIYRLCGSDF